MLWLLGSPQAIQAEAEWRRCVGITDDMKRLACFDKAAGRLLADAKSSELIVIDREKLRKARRARFGLNELARARSSGDDPLSQRIDQLETRIQSLSRAEAGRWIVTLAEGGRWQTTEAWDGPDPKTGVAVTIRRAALGNYVLKATGARAVRVKRVG